MHHKFTRRSVFQLTGAGLALPVIQSNLLENGLMPFAPKFVDLVRNVTSVTGTGPVTLGAAVPGYTSLADAVSSGDQFYYCIQGVDKPTEREVGRGTMQADGKIARQPIAGSPTSFTGGTKTIAQVAPAEWFAKLDQLGSGAMASVASRSQLASKSEGRAYLAEGGRAGNFVFDPSNMSAKVAGDGAQGMYVAPASDPSGASGAWVRHFDGAVNVRWFGAVGDGVTDDSAAFLAAIAFLKAVKLYGYGYGSGSGDLFVPAGHYFIGATTLDLTHTMAIRGEAMGLTGGGSTVLRWAPAATGIRVHAYNTTGASGVITSPPDNTGGVGSTIERLFLKGGFTGTEGEFHGIHLRGMATVRDVYISGFPGDGIHAQAAAGGGSEGNANLTRIQNVTIEHCRNGIYFDSADSNACSIIAANLSTNRQWGVYDSSFLGNSYFGCHSASNGWDGALGSIPTGCTYLGNRYYVKAGQAAGASTNAPSGTTADNIWWGYTGAGGASNGVVAWASGTSFRDGGSYKTDDPNAANLFIGCYAEGDQNPPQLISPTLVVGGFLSYATRGNAGFLRGLNGAVASSAFKSLEQATGHYVQLSEPYGLEYYHSTKGSFTLEWSGQDLAWTPFHSGNPSTWAFRLTGEATTLNIGKRRLDFPNGFGLNDKKILPGTAAPTNGAFVQGDMVLNSAPAAGGPMGWMCVSGGSPGTWKAMANLAA